MNYSATLLVDYPADLLESTTLLPDPRECLLVQSFLKGILVAGFSEADRRFSELTVEGVEVLYLPAGLELTKHYSTQ